MDYIKEFGVYLTGVRKAENTVNSYTGDVKGFIKFLSERDITFGGTQSRFTITSYKKRLQERDYEPNIINYE